MKQQNRLPWRLLTWVFIFAATMAYLESAVVVYMRQLYYPDGFCFPILIIPKWLVAIEIGREAATLIMLIAVAFVAGKNRWTRLSYFMFSFGVWDIWYYIWLKIFLNWPESLLTWDLLFFIPAPWSGPVLAPVIVSISLIVGALVVLHFESRNIRFGLSRWEWVLLVTAPVLIFISFIWDAALVLNEGVPERYRWELLLVGELIGFYVLLRAWKRMQNQLNQ